MIAQALLAGYANPLRVVDAADFDGSTNYLNRGAQLTGIADGKRGIVSLWFRLDGGDGFGQYALQLAGGGVGFSVLRTSGNLWQVNGFNTVPASIFTVSTAATHTQSATWKHLLCSWDLSLYPSADGVHLYISDVVDESSLSYVDDTIDYTVTDCVVGANGTANKFNGGLAEIYFNSAEYLDFSNVANRRKFISSGGKPVHLGTDGSFPTGTAPMVYLHLDDGEAVANFATNRGTGGNFTIAGTLATASSSPSD